MIWQVPPADLPFHSEHYDPFWAAAQEMDAPISIHILTGHGYNKNMKKLQGVERYRCSVNLKMLDVANAVFEFIFYGIFERFPGLKIVSVENEIGWLPFMVQQWDYYYRRFREVNPPPFKKDPSEYSKAHVYATFFNDAVGGHNLSRWGDDNCMWSNDYPHPNSHLAELSQSHPERPRAPVTGKADQAAVHERQQSVPSRHSLLGCRGKGEKGRDPRLGLDGC